MTRANKALAVLVVAALGLWGCAQGPANGAGSAERIKALEGKCAKLEDDYRAVASARDQLRKKLAEADEQRGRLKADLEQLQPVVKEHEELRQQLTVRTTERDNLQAQFESFRKNLRNLLGQAEAALPTASQPQLSAADGARAGKS
jgi:chromosome segregation ATPase